MTDRLVDAGWTRRGPFWSPPGSNAKWPLAGALKVQARMAALGPRPTDAWRKADIAKWLEDAGAPVPADASKSDLLEIVRGL